MQCHVMSKGDSCCQLSPLGRLPPYVYGLSVHQIQVMNLLHLKMESLRTYLSVNAPLC